MDWSQANASTADATIAELRQEVAQLSTQLQSEHDARVRVEQELVATEEAHVRAVEELVAKVGNCTMQYRPRRGNEGCAWI